MSDAVDPRLVRLVGEISALHRDAKVTLVIRSPALPAGGEVVVSDDDLAQAVAVIERKAGHAFGAGGGVERLRAALEAAADRFGQVAATLEHLGLEAQAANARAAEREARAALGEEL
jgi:hypothetical protein